MDKNKSNSIKFNCIVKKCYKMFDDYYNYSKHLTGHHGLPINIMNLKFDDMDKFNEWKKSEEHVNKCMFIKVSDGFYKCHRSDFILNSVDETRLVYAEDEDIYRIKSPCPAQIVLKIKDDNVNVIYVRTHFGYCTELKFIGISLSTQKKVKDLIIKKMNVNEILIKIKDDLIDKNDTDYLITTRHIEDIKENMKDEII